MKVRHPLLALGVYLGIGMCLWWWGPVSGSLVVVDLACGLLIYAFLSSLLDK